MVPIVAGRRGRKASPGQAAAVLLVVALLLLGLGAWFGQDAEGILQHMGTVTGRVVGLELRSQKGGKRPSATVRYDVEGSTVWLMNQRVGRDVREGDAVEVIYDRREPAHASLKSPRELRAIWVLLVGLGAAFLAGAAIAFGVAQQGSRPST